MNADEDYKAQRMVQIAYEKESESDLEKVEAERRNTGACISNRLFIVLLIGICIICMSNAFSSPWEDPNYPGPVSEPDCKNPRACA